MYLSRGILLSACVSIFSGCSMVPISSFTSCDSETRECVIDAQQQGNLYLSCDESSGFVTVTSDGELSSSTFSIENGVLSHRANGKKPLTNNKKHSLSWALGTNNKIYVTPNNGINPEYSSRPLTHDSGMIARLNDECNNAYIAAIEQRKKRQEAERIAQLEAKNRHNESIREEVERLASKSRSNPYPYRIDLLVESMQRESFLKQSNVTFATDGASIYTIKQYIGNSTYMVTAPYQLNALPLLVKSEVPLYEGHKLRDFIGTYNGVTTYKSVLGTMKQAISIDLLKVID